MTNTVNVQFQGFHPSEFTLAYVDRMLAKIQDRAPHGSVLRATFSRQKDLIVATLRVVSGVGDYFAIARGRRLRHAGRRLTAQITRRMERNPRGKRHGYRQSA
ncbi:MAG TPA: hypothetical protein PKC28_03500 [Bdellovibrionales bacterium]|nr:hypothetical protein [Bdellovibrionales bacterium]